jgi:phenylalanyl-tRNA synthetase beta chain
MLRDELPVQSRNFRLECEEQVRDILVGSGLDEVITYSLTGTQTILAMQPGQTEIDESLYLKLANPLTSDREYLRRSLLGSLLETMRDNFRFVERVALFELGRVYWPRPDAVLPDEPRRLGIALGGPRDERSWLGDKGLMDFYDLKGAVEVVLQGLDVRDAAFEPVAEAGFHPGRTARLMIEGKSAGVLGQIHPEIAQKFDLPAIPIYAGELDLNMLCGRAVEARQLTPISRFPAVSQDIAVIVDENIPAASVRAEIAEAGSELLVNSTLFDVYRDERIGAGKKSLAYALTFQAMDRTLTGEEVEGWVLSALDAAKALGAQLRS